MSNNLPAVIAVVLVSVASPAQSTTLRRQLKQDSTDVYKVAIDVSAKSNSSSFGEGDLSVNSTMTLTLKSGKLDSEGRLGVDADISGIDARVDGSIAQYVSPMLDALPKEIRLTGKIGPLGQLSLDRSNAPDVMLAMMIGANPSSSIGFVEFPDKPVSVGDSWTFPAPKNPIFAKDSLTLSAKFSGEKDYNGAKVWSVEVQGKLNIKADATDLVKGRPGADEVRQQSIKGAADVTGEALIDEATGKTRRYVLNLVEKTSKEIPDMNMTVESSSSIRITMTLAN